MNERYEGHENTPQDAANEHAASPEYERVPGLQPRVWIGSLADYNAGILTGEWTPADVEDETLIQIAQRVVARSETPDAEEWAIFDHEGFGDFQVGQHEDLAIVARVARGIAEHGGRGEAFAFWANLHDADEAMCAAFSDAYLGEFDTPADWAREVIDEHDLDAKVERSLGEHLARYVHFDAEGFAQDAWLGGDIHLANKPDGGYWVFAGNV